jgi:flavin-dependent dehydrogenase
MPTDVVVKDVVIVGAGPSGSSAALTLLRQGCTVALLTRGNQCKNGFGESAPPSLSHTLKQLQIWEQFLQQKHRRCFVTRSAWSNPEWDEQDYSMHPDGAWWLLDHSAFDSLLRGCARDNGALTLEVSGRMEITRERNGDWVMEGDGREDRFKVRAKFLMDASGRRAIFARRFGARSKIYDELVALVVLFSSMGQPDPKEAYILTEACENGWWYSALLPDNRMAVVLMTDTSIIKKCGANPTTFWMNEFSRSRLTRKRIALVGENVRPVCVSVASVETEPASVHGFIAVGDAGHTIDPLSSQGILNALESGRRGALAVSSELAGGRTGTETYLSDEKARFDTYLVDRKRYYSKVRRFATLPFWQKRTAILHRRDLSVAL